MTANNILVLKWHWKNFCFILLFLCASYPRQCFKKNLTSNTEIYSPGPIIYRYHNNESHTLPVVPVQICYQKGSQLSFSLPLPYFSRQIHHKHLLQQSTWSLLYNIVPGWRTIQSGMSQPPGQLLVRKEVILILGLLLIPLSMGDISTCQVEWWGNFINHRHSAGTRHPS